jgi:hypothetical protein
MKKIITTAAFIVAAVIGAVIWAGVASNNHQQAQQRATQTAQQQQQQADAWYAAQRQQQAAAQAAQQQQQALGVQVQLSLQNQLDTAAFFRQLHLKVTGVSLVRADPSRYDGIATVCGPSGAAHNVLVHVTVDATGAMMWHTDQGAFLWAVDE